MEKEKKQYDVLREQIEQSGLTKSFVAGKVNVSSAHLSMMLNGKTNLPEETRLKIKSLIDQANKISV